MQAIFTPDVWLISRDRLFSINKARKDCTGVKERHWFSTASDWCIRADGVDQTDGQTAGLNEKGDSVLQDGGTVAASDINDSVVHADDFDHGVR